MYTSAEKTPEKKSQALTDPLPKQGMGDAASPIEDNRPAMVAQLKLKASTTASAAPAPAGSAAPASLAEPNNTGLPDSLKTGVENLSGVSLDNVQVHYNSPEPAQLAAHAYAQGNEIHLGPGQEKHLPHEAWHVAQQAQGRVQETAQMKGVSINGDSGLEKEADTMGAKAMKVGTGTVGGVQASGRPVAGQSRAVAQKQASVPATGRAVAQLAAPGGIQHAMSSCFAAALINTFTVVGPLKNLLNPANNVIPDGHAKDLQGLLWRCVTSVDATQLVTRDVVKLVMASLAQNNIIQNAADTADFSQVMARTVTLLSQNNANRGQANRMPVSSGEIPWFPNERLQDAVANTINLLQNAVHNYNLAPNSVQVTRGYGNGRIAPKIFKIFLANDTTVTYRLKSIIERTGKYVGGHFISHIDRGGNGPEEWHKSDDLHPDAVEAIPNIGTHPDDMQRNGYAYIYERNNIPVIANTLSIDLGQQGRETLEALYEQHLDQYLKKEEESDFNPESLKSGGSKDKEKQSALSEEEISKFDKTLRPAKEGEEFLHKDNVEERIKFFNYCRRLEQEEVLKVNTLLTAYSKLPTLDMHQRLQRQMPEARTKIGLLHKRQAELITHFMDKGSSVEAKRAFLQGVIPNFEETDPALVESISSRLEMAESFDLDKKETDRLEKEEKARLEKEKLSKAVKTETPPEEGTEPSQVEHTEHLQVEQVETTELEKTETTELEKTETTELEKTETSELDKKKSAALEKAFVLLKGRMMTYIIQGLGTQTGKARLKEYEGLLGDKRKISLGTVAIEMGAGLADIKQDEFSRKQEERNPGEDDQLLESAGNNIPEFIDRRFGKKDGRTPNPQKDSIGDLSMYLDRDKMLFPVYIGQNKKGGVEMYSSPLFTAMHHETGHSVNFLKGVSGGGNKYKGKGKTDNKILQVLTDEEEVHNISLDQHSDKVMSGELGLPERIAHGSYMGFDYAMEHIQDETDYHEQLQHWKELTGQKDGKSSQIRTLQQQVEALPVAKQDFHQYVSHFLQLVTKELSKIKPVKGSVKDKEPTIDKESTKDEQSPKEQDLSLDEPNQRLADAMGWCLDQLEHKVYQRFTMIQKGKWSTSDPEDIEVRNLRHDLNLIQAEHRKYISFIIFCNLHPWIDGTVEDQQMANMDWNKLLANRSGIRIDEDASPQFTLESRANIAKLMSRGTGRKLVHALMSTSHGLTMHTATKEQVEKMRKYYVEQQGLKGKELEDELGALYGGRAGPRDGKSATAVQGEKGPELNEGSYSTMSMPTGLKDSERTSVDERGNVILSPNFIELGHEMIHSLQNVRGANLNGFNKEQYDQSPWDNMSEHSVIAGTDEMKDLLGEDDITENMLREEHDLGVRHGHSTLKVILPFIYEGIYNIVQKSAWDKMGGFSKDELPKGIGDLRKEIHKDSFNIKKVKEVAGDKADRFRVTNFFRSVDDKTVAFYKIVNDFCELLALGSEAPVQAFQRLLQQIRNFHL